MSARGHERSEFTDVRAARCVRAWLRAWLRACVRLCARGRPHAGGADRIDHDQPQSVREGACTHAAAASGDPVRTPLAAAPTPPAPPARLCAARATLAHEAAEERSIGVGPSGRAASGGTGGRKQRSGAYSAPGSPRASPACCGGCRAAAGSTAQHSACSAKLRCKAQGERARALARMIPASTYARAIAWRRV